MSNATHEEHKQDAQGMHELPNRQAVQLEALPPKQSTCSEVLHVDETAPPSSHAEILVEPKSVQSNRCKDVLPSPPEMDSTNTLPPDKDPDTLPPQPDTQILQLDMGHTDILPSLPVMNNMDTLPPQPDTQTLQPDMGHTDTLPSLPLMTNTNTVPLLPVMTNTGTLPSLPVMTNTDTLPPQPDTQTLQPDMDHTDTLPSLPVMTNTDTLPSLPVMTNTDTLENSEPLWPSPPAEMLVSSESVEPSKESGMHGVKCIALEKPVSDLVKSDATCSSAQETISLATSPTTTVDERGSAGERSASITMVAEHNDGNERRAIECRDVQSSGQLALMVETADGSHEERQPVALSDADKHAQSMRSVTGRRLVLSHSADVVTAKGKDCQRKLG